MGSWQTEYNNRNSKSIGQSVALFDPSAADLFVDV
jgi:hypothetical protein